MSPNSSFLSLVLTTVTATIIFGSFSVAARNSQNSALFKTSYHAENATIVSGSYIVRLNDTYSAEEVTTTALETAMTMQSLKAEMIANGTIDATSNDPVDVPSNRIWTNCINGFLIKGVSDVMLSSLLQTPGVNYVEPVVAGSINSVSSKSHSRKQGVRSLLHKQLAQILNKGHTRKQGIRSMQRQVTQITPWGVARVGGPIDINTVPNPFGKVFVIDTGISAKTNDLNIDTTLSINLVAAYLTDIDPSAWEDLDGHGTHVAGTIAALDNGINVVGVVPGASVVAVKVMNSGFFFDTSDMIAGVEHVYIHGTKGDVVNISIFIPGSYPSAFNAAVENTASRGIKFAIAAGNQDRDAVCFSPNSAAGDFSLDGPALNIYTVSCFDQTDSMCSFSNYGQVVDVSAPGKDIYSLSIDGGIKSMDGTSMSAPHIAGLLFANSFASAGTINSDKDIWPDPIFVYNGVVPSTVPPASNNLIFYILPDQYSATDNYWNLIRTSPGPPTVVASRPLGLYKYDCPKCWWKSFVNNLPIGTYRLDLYDVFGDGLTPPSYFKIYFDNGVVLKSGGSFTNAISTYFTVTSGPTSTDSIVVTDAFFEG